MNYYLQPGYIIVTGTPYLVHTVLGSCVSVCLWDEKLKVGGMNHYIYSEPFKDIGGSKYGNISIPQMLRMMQKLGAEKENLKAHLVGGAWNPDLTSSVVGKENIRIGEKLLEQYGIRIYTRDVGGNMGRKVVFDIETGELLLYKVNNIRRGDWYDTNKSSDY